MSWAEIGVRYAGAALLSFLIFWLCWQYGKEWSRHRKGKDDSSGPEPMC